MNIILKVVLLLSLSFSVYGQKLTAIEAQIVKEIDDYLPTARYQLEQVVNINSGTMNFSGVQQVGMYFKKQLDALGFDTYWQSGEAFGRAGHLVANYGNTGKKVLLIGHLDTVFAKDDSFQKYLEINERYVSGPGLTDMKGGNVIMISAIRALKKLGLLENINLRIVLTGDEEKSGSPLNLSKQAIVDAAKWAEIALGFEDGDSNIKTAVISRRGAINWTLTVTGKAAHSSQIFTENIGDGAILEMARILNDFRQSLSSIENLTFNPGLVLGGTTTSLAIKNSNGNSFGKNNVIAKSANATGDIRAISPKQLQQTKKTMREIVRNNLPYTCAEIIFHSGYPPMPPTALNKKLLGWYSQVSEDLGYGKVIAVNPRKAGAADISFAANHVDMSLDGLGLMGEGGHTINEVADMSSFSKNTYKAALLIYRLSLL